MATPTVKQPTYSTRVYDAVFDATQQLGEKFSNSLPAIANTVINVAPRMITFIAVSQMAAYAEAYVSPEPCFRRCEMIITNQSNLNVCYEMCQKAFEFFFDTP